MGEGQSWGAGDKCFDGAKGYIKNAVVMSEGGDGYSMKLSSVVSIPNGLG